MFNKQKYTVTRFEYSFHVLENNMNYKNALAFIHSIPKFRRPLGNANLSKLLAYFDNPQKQLSFIHIAGTNGKGSTAAMTAEILKRAGFKTGLFTSPFIETFNERIRIDGELISDSELALYTGRVKTAMEKNNAPVSEFAFVTAMALLYFYDKQCDFVVLEVGMGGALDATNIIDTSLVSVICKIGLDHTQYLGNTIEEIAREKCGIIKEGGAVVSYPNGRTDKITASYAAEKGASLTVAETPEITKNGFIYKGEEYPLSLKGSYQPQNAAVVIEVIEALRSKGIKIPPSTVRKGLANTHWAARFEYIGDRLIIDGGHNLDGIRALKRSLLDLKRDIVLVIAMMEDKDYNNCIREIAPIAKAVFATELDMPRCLSADKIADIARGMNIPVYVNNNPEDAVKEALTFGESCAVCVCGSLFLAGEVRKKFCKNTK